MAIELISTVIPKNNGNFPIVLSNDIKGGIHSVNTANDMKNISSERLDSGMLCYVGDENTYYHYINNEWQLFTAGGSGLFYVAEYKDLAVEIPVELLHPGLLCYVENEKSYYSYINGAWVLFKVTESLSFDDSFQRIIRTDTEEELMKMNTNVLNIGTGNMAFVKENSNTYIYTEDGWVSTTIFSNKIHVGSTPPKDKTMLWIDTTDDILTEHTVLSSTDNLILQAILESVQALRKDVDDIKAIIKNGNITWPDEDEKTEVVTYIIHENGDFFITEDGDFIIDEYIEYIENDNNAPDGILLLENGDFFITEDGNLIVDEQYTENSNDNNNTSNTKTNEEILLENGDFLITELKEYIIGENYIRR